MDTGPHDIAWAAGIFEGEGSIILRPAGRNRPGYQRRLQVPMTDEDVVVRFWEVVDAGNVRKDKFRRPGHKWQWRWTCSRWADTERILRSFLPYLMSRRRQMAETLLANPAGPVGRVMGARCKRGHPMSGPEADVLVYATYRQCRCCVNQRNERERHAAQAEGVSVAELRRRRSKAFHESGRKR